MILPDTIKKKQEKDEIDLSLFFELAEEYKIGYNQTPVNTLIEDMEKLESGFFTNDVFVYMRKENMKLIDFLDILANWQNS